MKSLAVGLIVDREEVDQHLRLLAHVWDRLRSAIKQGSGSELEKRSMSDALELEMVALAQTVKEIKRHALPPENVRSSG